MSKDSNFWGKVGGVLGIAVLSAGLVHLDYNAFGPKPIDTSKFVTVSDLDKTNVKIDSLTGPLGAVTVLQTELTSLSSNTIFQEDAFKSQSEVLASDDVKVSHYKGLVTFLLDNNVTTNLVGNEKFADLNLVVTERKVDVTVSKANKDSEVVRELRVVFEDKNGNEVRKYITATTEIVDGEVDVTNFYWT
jgi:hypothetical protein